MSKNAEARLFFEEGNRLYQSAHDAQDASRERLLRQALQSYLDSLRIVRSRNALFNAAIVLEELGRSAASFNYYTEYLSIAGLTQDEREEADRRRDALRPSVAVLRLSSSPEGATVWVDRKDLAPLGTTPLEIALTPGTHKLLLEQAEHRSIETTTELELGVTRTLRAALDPLPSPAATVLALTAPEPLLSAMPSHVSEQDSEPPPARLRNAAIGTGASTLASLGVALGLSIRASTLGDEQRAAAEQARESGSSEDMEHAERLADQTDRFNLAADVFWGASIGFGVSAITTGLLYRKKKRHRDIDVAASASRTGGFASVRIPLGRPARP